MKNPKSKKSKEKKHQNKYNVNVVYNDAANETENKIDRIFDFYKKVLRKEFDVNNINTNANKYVLVLILIIISFGFGYILGGGSWHLNNNVNRQLRYFTEEELNKVKIDLDFAYYKQVIANLKQNYVEPDKIDDQKLFESGLKGIVAGVGDPHTFYMTAQEYRDFKESMAGRVEGIGAKLSYENKKVVVDEVLKDSPAERAGVKKGFVFIEVDKVNVESMTIEEIVNRVRGPAGTSVGITFYNPYLNAYEFKNIVREPVYADSIELITEKYPGVIVLKINRFTEDTVAKWNTKWDEIVERILKEGNKPLIIDLRGNGGGYLESAVYASSDFVDIGKVLLTVRERNGENREIKSPKLNPKLKDYKVVLLVNGGTASASEIFASALRHYKKHKIIGTKTYGKGTVQRVIDMPDGGGLKITVEYWLLPDGSRLNHENPLKPDVEVLIDGQSLLDGVDTQMNKAVEIIKSN